MKKFLFLVLLAVCSYGATAQRATLIPLAVGDTIVTSSSADTVTKIITATAGYSALGIQVNGVKISGTITVKAYLYGSLDGVTYVVTDSTAAFANASSSVFITKTGGIPYVYYKIQVRNVGTIGSTESMALRFYYVFRKYDRTL